MGRTPAEIAADMRSWPCNLKDLADEVAEDLVAKEVAIPPPPPVAISPVDASVALELVRPMVTSTVLAPPQSASSIAQNGVTWTFNEPCQVGQYVNGDWWVCVPVELTITSITPVSADVGGRWQHGSEINPNGGNGTTQGFDNGMGPYKSNGDSRAPYSAALNVADSMPLAVPVGSSLVSTITSDTVDDHPQIETAVVLTVVDEIQQADAFRPPYSSTDKTSYWFESQIDYSVLNTLAPTASAPSISSIVDDYANLWLDFAPPDWIGRKWHPSNSMRVYGRDIAHDVATACLLLNTSASNTDKRLLLIRIIQIGIDLYGAVNNGSQGAWEANGGNGNGRKLPILVAALVFNDANMLATLANSKVVGGAISWSEDEQTFTVEETPPGSGVYNNDNPDAHYRSLGYQAYNASHVGLGEYGIRHYSDPARDDSKVGARYRFSAGSTFPGTAMAAISMTGGEAAWNWEHFWKYALDRHVEFARAEYGEFDTRVAPRFHLEMYDAYRDLFRP